MKIILKDKEYNFLTGYQENDLYRVAFNNLSKNVFGLSFEEWFQSGYWKEKYIPYTLFDSENAIANVSVNIMNFSILGEQKCYIQIGTVMTDERYRHRGLNRFLMEKILNEWNQKCDLIYLFANSTVLEFYPKFGFERTKEYSYFKSIQKNFEHRNVEKLNMDLQSNRTMLYSLAKNSKAFGKISMKENADLVMFYCITILKESVYYIETMDTIVVATFNDKQLQIWDIFGKRDVELDRIIHALANSQTEEVVLGFTPNDTDSYKVREITGDDMLFVQLGKTPIFDENQLMFPLLSHA